MKQNHFVIPYSGNKRKEVEVVYNMIESKINENSIIVEPFCGTSAFSYYIYTKNKDKNLKYILNDNSKNIYDLYNICKDKDKLADMYNKLIELFKQTPDKTEYLKVCKKAREGDLLSWVYINKIYSIRAGLFPTNKAFTEKSLDTFKKAPIIDFLQNANITITNDDGLDVYNHYKQNENAIIFIDPPYIQSCNTFYNSPKGNIYEYLHFNDFEKEKAIILLCLENIWIIQLLFKGKKSITYDKTYDLSKKKTEHVFIYKL
jgi:16S rRNA G966 N2-methylase RsmD